jgi:acetyl esterase/lipase
MESLHFFRENKIIDQKKRPVTGAFFFARGIKFYYPSEMRVYLKLPTFLFAFVFCVLACSCSVSKHKGITYLEADAGLKTEELKLNVYSPENIDTKKDVIIFLHGGGWNKGKRSQYDFFGKRMARKDVVGVIMDYPLSPKANYNDMAIATAKAVKWVHENISKYGGDPERIFISGHSAGGHLAALVAVKQKYFDNIGLRNPLKGVILIDAAGLDMNQYLTDQEAKGGDNYLGAFTNDHAQWKEASPIYHLHKGVPPMFLLTGGKTYPNIKDSNERFVKELSKHTSSFEHQIVKRKHHVPMIFQFYNSRNTLYKEIIRFMKEQK